LIHITSSWATIILTSTTDVKLPLQGHIDKHIFSTLRTRILAKSLTSMEYL